MMKREKEFKAVLFFMYSKNNLRCLLIANFVKILNHLLQPEGGGPGGPGGAQMHRIEGFGPLPYMGISTMKRVAHFKMNYI